MLNCLGRLTGPTNHEKANIVLLGVTVEWVLSGKQNTAFEDAKAQMGDM